MAKSSFGKRTRKPGYKPGDHWVECQRTGHVIRASDARKEWTGLIVSKDEWESRHPQDFLRGFLDDTSAKGLVNPEDFVQLIYEPETSAYAGLAVAGKAVAGATNSTPKEITGTFNPNTL